MRPDGQGQQGGRGEPPRRSPPLLGEDLRFDLATGILSPLSERSERLFGPVESGSQATRLVCLDDVDREGIARLLRSGEVGAWSEPCPLRFRAAGGGGHLLPSRLREGAPGSNAIDVALPDGEPGVGDDLVAAEVGALGEATGDVVVMVDAEGRVVFANATVEAVLGLPAVHWLETPFFGRIDVADREEAGAWLGRILARESVGTRPWRFTHADGSLRVLDVSGRALRRAGGLPRAILVGRDVTGLREAKEMRLRCEAQLELIRRSLPVAFYLAPGDPTRGRHWLTREVARQTGLRLEDFRAYPDLWSSRLHPEDRDRVLQAFTDVEPDAPQVLEYRWRVGGGTYRWYRDACARLPAPDAGGFEVAGVWLDVTDHHVLRRELTHTRALSLLGRVATRLAHELVDPLTGVVGFAELLRGAGDLPPEIRDHADRIRREAGRVQEILEGFLSMSWGRRPVPRPLRLSTVLERVTRSRSYSLGLGDIRLVIDSPERDPTVLADPGQLEQVLLGLVLHLEEDVFLGGSGGGEIRIHVPETGPRERVRIEVSGAVAEGEGVDLPGDRPAGQALRVEAAEDPLIPLVAGIVREHGGELTVVSRSGRGAEFVVLLPAAAGPEAAEAGGEAPPGEDRLDGTRVLVVDDQESVLDLARSILEDRGALVLASSCPLEALKLVEEAPFDVVISDLMMPGMGGREFYARCRKLRPDLADRFLFLSGQVVENQSHIRVGSHSPPLLCKPFALRELVKQVRALAIGSEGEESPRSRSE